MRSGGIAVGAGSLWVGSGVGTILRVDPVTLVVESRIRVPGGAILILGPGSFGSGSLWATKTVAEASSVDPGSLVRIDPATKSVVATVEVGAGPIDPAVGGGFAWILNGFDGTVTRIRPAP